MTITARAGQTVFDIAIMAYGDLEGLLFLIEDNGDIVFQEDITGVNFDVRETVINQRVVAYFDDNISIVTF